MTKRLDNLRAYVASPEVEAVTALIDGYKGNHQVLLKYLPAHLHPVALELLPKPSKRGKHPRNRTTDDVELDAAAQYAQKKRDENPGKKWLTNTPEQQAAKAGGGKFDSKKIASRRKSLNRELAKLRRKSMNRRNSVA